jgi:ferredoxin
MTYVVTQPCAGSKDHSCIDVCPVDCIQPMDEDEFAEVTQVYIDPATCIDCGACVTQCPVDAIYPEKDVPQEWLGYIAINAEHFSRG